MTTDERIERAAKAIQDEYESGGTALTMARAALAAADGVNDGAREIYGWSALSGSFTIATGAAADSSNDLTTAYMLGHSRGKDAADAAHGLDSMLYFTATSDMYDVSQTIDTEPQYATSFTVAGGPFTSIEDAADTSEDFVWIIGFQGVEVVSVHSAGQYEVGDKVDIDDFERPRLDDFLYEIVQDAIAHRKEDGDE